MQNILVTGGAGFIGSNFVRLLLQKYPNYHIYNLDKLTYAGSLQNLQALPDPDRHHFIQGDVCDSKIVENVAQHCQAVVHLAAETHVDRSILEAGEFVKTDVFGTFVMLEAAKKFKHKKFVHISTDEVYGEAPGRLSRVEDPLLPLSPYAASKAGADRLAYSYFTTYGLPVIISRCTNNFGPYQLPEKMIPLFITNALDKLPLPVYGDGKNTRDWIFVQDHCQAIDLLLHDTQHNGQVFNIGADNEYSILEITEFILNYLKGSRDLIKFVPDRAAHVRRHAVDWSETNKVLGWKPKATFWEELTKTIDWYVKNRIWWEKAKERCADFFNKHYK